MMLSSSSAPYQFSGIMVEVMDIIAGHLDFCFHINVPEGMDWGRQLENKTFTGMLGEFERKEWDMTVSPVGASHTRYQVMDFSTPLFMDETTVIYIRPRPMADMMGFIKPYTPLMWTLLFLSAIVATAIILLVQMDFHCQHYKTRLFIASGKNNGSNSGVTEEARKGWRSAIKSKLHRAIQWVACSLLSQTVAWEPQRTSVRLVAGLWLLASFIVASVYRSNLKAMLILPRTPLPFNTVSELTATDITTYVIKGSLIDHAIKAAAPNSTLGHVRNQVVVTSDVPSAIPGIYKGQYAAFSSRLGLGPLSLGSFALTGYCSLYIIKEGFLGTSISLAFPKGSFLIPKVNRVISGLRESGLLQRLYITTLGNASHCMEPITTSTTIDIQLRPLELQDFFGVLTVFSGGLLLALLTFLLEIVISSSHYRKSDHF